MTYATGIVKTLLPLSSASHRAVKPNHPCHKWSAVMNLDDQIKHRRAIEALRSGVPNRDAVLALGCTQPEIEKMFRQRLQDAKQGLVDGSKTYGMLVEGDFGTGKSHLLEYLQHLALEQN